MKAQEKMKKENSSSFMKNVAMLMIAQILIKILGFVYRYIKSFEFLVKLYIPILTNLDKNTLESLIASYSVFFATYIIISWNTYNNF